MRLINVGISEMKVCCDPDGALITYALGSCIALVAWDPVRRLGGMIHYMLPSASVSATKAEEKPAMFADTGIPLLLERMGAIGCRRTLVLKAAGGAARWNDGGTFDIGRRNFVALRKLLWQQGLLLTAQDVGGTCTRTVRLELDTGRTVVRTDGVEHEL
jgi:chemotaxis protein CheD